MKIVLCDIDGTIADLSHRIHHISNGRRNYDAFHDGCVDDKPIWQIIDLVKALAAQGYHIIFVSGRTDRIREETTRWLLFHELGGYLVYMRSAGDYRKDDIVKRELLHRILEDLKITKGDIDFVIDDRNSVVKMWRDEGLICLHCDDWNDREKPKEKGLLTLMVGPSGAGKSHYLMETRYAFETYPDSIISSDSLRAQLCDGNFRDQSKNDQVFAAAHAIIKTRLDYGLPAVFDATNIKRADRLAAAKLAGDGKVRYIVLDRPLEEKLQTAGWRAEVPGLIERHHQTFQSQLKDILRGDGLPNVEVLDRRKL